MLLTKEPNQLIKFSFLFVVFCNAVVDISHKILLQNIVFKIFDGSEQVIWISVINALIILPFLLLFSTSGYLSDRYNKKDILVYGALSSLTLSVLMVAAYATGSFETAMFVLVLLAVQSAIYSPAKFGIIIEIYGKENLSAGNSALQGITIIAMLFAMAMTSYIFESFFTLHSLETYTTKEGLLGAILPLTYYVIPVALLEFLISFLILKKIKTTTTTTPTTFSKKALLKGELLSKNIQAIVSNSVILLSVIGLATFWAVSQGLVVVFPSFAKAYLEITNTFVINGIIASSGVGIAVGSLLYAKLSKHYIEVGTIPIAALGMALTIYLAISVESVYLLGFAFFAFGMFGGLFIVPLNALIQFNAKQTKLGTILAGNNWFQSLFMFSMLLMTTIFALNHVDTLTIIYIILSITLIGSIYTIYKLPQSMVLLFLKFIVGLRYKLDVHGIKNIPSNGGVLLLGNHISWIDWAIVLMSTPREVKFVMDRGIYNRWYINWLLKIFKAIPISGLSSKSALQAVAKNLDEGHVVVLFPEGSITRNGHLGEFKKGFEKILALTETEVKVTPFYIKGLWESMFSRATDKYKKNNRTSHVTISFGTPLTKQDANTVTVKKAVVTLSSLSWKQHIATRRTLSETIFDRLKSVSNELIFADSTGMELSGNKFLTLSILFKQLLSKKISGQNIGLLLPSTATGAFTNYAMLLMGKTSINLNYTTEIQALKASIKSAEIKSIVASKKFVEKLQTKGIAIDEVLALCDVIYLEDIKPEISKTKAILTIGLVKLLPSFILKPLFVKRTHKDDTVMILFSSGSEGTPKGIELSSDNILGNSKQISNILNINENDTILGSLPLFHAFGIVVTTYLPLVEGIKCVAHPDPTDGVGIGQIVSRYKATIMCGTSTFLRLYTKNKKVHPLMFESLRLVVAGAEKLRDDVKRDFKTKFGKDIFEGFGTTETSPVATCNIPDVLAPNFSVQKGNKNGTVGMAIPGTTVKIVDPDSLEELETNEEGMIMISGVQVMKGYLHNQAKSDEVLKKIDGKTYYMTGDKGKIDEDGFLTIVDRYSRFAKLGGEMVSLTSVENQISKLFDMSDENIDYIATVLEDEKKGEKIVLLISGIDTTEIEALKSKINTTFDNKLMIPSEIKIVEEIPKLGSGKKDFKGAQKLAQSL